MHSSTSKSKLLQFTSVPLYCMTLGKALNLAGVFNQKSQLDGDLSLPEPKGHHEFPGCFAHRPVGQDVPGDPQC